MKAPIVTDMQKKIRELGQKKSYAFVDLGITKEEWDFIDQLKFTQLSPEATSEYDRFGSLHLLKTELPIFLRTLGNNDEEVLQTVTEVISRTVDHVLEATHKNSAWVSVRASVPTPAFNLPRWHIDGAYYGLDHSLPSLRPVLKFAAVLKGSPTLLYPLPEDKREEFNLKMSHREALAKLLDTHQVESPRKGEGVFFIVADTQLGAVHSEPKIDENRLFFSILVGEEAEINELYLRWHPHSAS
ncbi:MAG: hypothetical protein JSS10_06215 [Verrucomicrobia bacterium]|nr:hypothetical protein [Verrucomicrobiota bacterium]